MIEGIASCSKCGLCSNQPPLLDNVSNASVFWVGLSAKMAKAADDVPLDPSTRSGGVVDAVGRKCSGCRMYRTNLVKCVPLDPSGRLRYPTAREMDACMHNLTLELGELHPQLVFLLGRKVADAVSKHYSTAFPRWDGFEYRCKVLGETTFVPIHHPSYISVYKRRLMDEYVSSLTRVIERVVA